jgi:hypothetical protein
MGVVLELEALQRGAPVALLQAIVEAQALPSGRRTGDVELGLGIAAQDGNGAGMGGSGRGERALLSGGRLTVTAARDGGAQVRLTVPTGEAA